MPEKLWERTKERMELLRDYLEVNVEVPGYLGTVTLHHLNAVDTLLAEMERVECVEGKADPSGGFWKNTTFPSDRPALLLLLPEEDR